ncbi:MAG: DUF2600 family protein [Solirubrobacteraceae bacterium]
MKRGDQLGGQEAVMADRRLVASAAGALALANVRYWSSVAPRARAELARWRARADRIPDPARRALALTRLSEVGFNAEAASTLATLAPRAHRARVVRAMVALEVIFDYLDGVTELAPEDPTADPLAERTRISRALVDAVSVDAGHGAHESGAAGAHDTVRCGRTDARGQDAYLEELVRCVRREIAGLPALGAVAHTMRLAAERGAQAQAHAHAAAQLGSAQTVRWAREQANGTGAARGDGWREHLAGAGSAVVSVHALMAAAADRRTTAADALRIDRAYASLGALATVLDSLVDYEADRAAGKLAVGYMRYYADRDELAGELTSLLGGAAACVREAPHAAHHMMTAVGIVAYYTTEPGAAGPFARPVVAEAHAALRPLIGPTLAIMRTWRAAKAIRARWARTAMPRITRTAAGSPLARAEPAAAAATMLGDAFRIGAVAAAPDGRSRIGTAGRLLPAHRARGTRRASDRRLGGRASARARAAGGRQRARGPVQRRASGRH